MKPRLIVSIIKTFKVTFSKFSQHRLIKLSASLSYYTIFSLPPMLIVIISMCSIFFGREAIQGEIFGMIEGYVGEKSAMQIQNTLSEITINENSFLASIIGIATLLFAATGIFGEIQDSINYIWGLKTKPKKGLIKLLLNRVLSFSMILVLGFILIVSLVLNSLVDILMLRLQAKFQDVYLNIFYIGNYLLIFLTITTLFAFIFKVLPDAKIKWKHVIPGALLTSFLFIVGKSLIGLYLSNNIMISAYGATGSVIVLLVWVYFSSMILYFGAEFTQVYLKNKGIKIEPDKYSVFIEKSVHEKENNLELK